MRIAGAGLAGLLAAHAWPQAEVFEAAAEPRAQHKALLRFRSDAVARLIGIDFHPVTVRKGIWMGGFVAPSIQMANLYSRKILGSIEPDRSIWSLEPVQRFIAPETLYEQLIETVGKRIHWATPWDYGQQLDVISTAPLPLVLERLSGRWSHHPHHPRIEFKRATIRVQRYRVKDCEAYQTIYFPDPEQPVYRASLTGSLLIVECAKGEEPEAWHLDEVLKAFGIYSLHEKLDDVEQKFGKIVPLEGGMRKALLHRLTAEFGVFSLGRFATWRNVLLDDVVEDIAVIRRLLRSSAYERRLHFA